MADGQQVIIVLFVYPATLSVNMVDMIQFKIIIDDNYGDCSINQFLKDSWLNMAFII